MGVSLQIYRVRIGIYTHAVRVKTAKEQSGNRSRIFRINWSFNIVTAAILIGLLGTIRTSQCTTGLPWTLNHSPSWTLQCNYLPCYPSQFEESSLARHTGFYLKATNLSLRQPATRITARCWNSFMKATNGNRSNKGRGIKLIAWNKGSSHLQNKHHEIESIIAAEKPHIVGLSEANLKQGTDLSLVQHEEYTLHTAPAMGNPQLRISRMVVYTHSSLVVKRRAWKTSHYLLSG